MAGKYAHITPKLPKFVNPDAKYQEKVQAIKAQILQEAGVSFLHASQLTRDYIAIRDEIDEINKQLYDANMRCEAVSQMMFEQFDAEGVGSLTVEGLGNVRKETEIYAQVKDKEKFRLWCVNVCQLCGLHKDKHAEDPDAFDHAPTTLESSLQLWPSTMNSITKERLYEGRPEPDGVEAFQKPKAVLTRAK